MVSKEQKIKEIKVFIGNNPSLNSNETLKEIRLKGLGIRKQEFQKIFREQKQLPEPTPEKREASIPIKFRPTKKPVKPTKPIKVKVDFEKTKFGKITKKVQSTFNISEKNAIRHTRKLLKIPKKDFRRLNQKDLMILTQFGY